MKSKSEKLDKLLKSGKWVHADMVREKCGIAQSGYHRMLFEWKKKNPGFGIIKQKVSTPNSYFMKHKAVAL